MIQAELKGKLPEVANREDVLTSNVLGMLKYIPPQRALFRILEEARDYSAARSTFLHNLSATGIELSAYDSVEYLFWENSPVYGEPDLILLISSSGNDRIDLMLCIEVKLLSEKSRSGDRDQLMD